MLTCYESILMLNFSWDVTGILIRWYLLLFGAARESMDVSA